MKYDIFISYRRDGGDTLAQLIYDRLTGRGYRVFLDIESLRSGKFNEKLLNVIEESNDVIVILPPNALDRCKNPGDWLFREVSHAIQCEKNLVPIMMKGFSWPEEMPEGIEELANYNGIADSKNYFDAVIDKLTTILVSQPATLKDMAAKNTTNPISHKIKSLFWKTKPGLVKWMVVALALVTVAFFLFLGKFEPETAKIEESESVSEAEEDILIENIAKTEEEQNQTIENIPTDLINIVLKPSEEMGMPDYQRAVEAIEQRVRILAKDSYYDYKEEGGQISIQLSEAVLGKEEDIRESVAAYLSRPVKLTLMSDNMVQGYFPISPEDIVDITIRQEKIRYVDTKEEYGFEAADDNTYFHIVFSEEINQQIRERFGQCEYYSIAQDFEEQGLGADFVTLIKADSEEGYYFADENQMANINELLLYNYTTETFSHSMLVDIRYPVEWEVVSKAENKGVNQCNEEEITGEQMVIYYQLASHEEEVTDGEAVDVMTVVKHRLDALGTPYAFGTTQNREHEFAVKIGIDKIGETILSMLVQAWPGIEIYHPYLYINSVSSELKTVQKEDGSYALGYTNLKEKEIEKLREEVERIKEFENTNLYLTYGNVSYTVLSKVDAERILEDLEQGKILFDNMIGFAMAGITEENKYLADFFVALMNIQMPKSYEIFSYYFENVEGFNPGLEILPMKNEYQAGKVAEYTEQILERYPKADISLNSLSELEIRMDLPLNDTTSQTMIDIMKDLYHNCGLKEGELPYSVWFTVTEESSVEIAVDFDRLNYEGQIYEVNAWGEGAEAFVDEFEILAGQDDFFKTHIVKSDPDVLYDFSFYSED